MWIPSAAGGDGGPWPSHGIRSGRPVAWLGSTMIGRVALALDVGNDRQVERVPRRILERPDPALAEDHLAVALGEDVFGRHQQVFDRRAHAALEQDRHAGSGRTP